jgi:four helix bundle protein
MWLLARLRTIPDRKNFFGIARGSAQECVPLLELARRRQLIQETDQCDLKAQLEENFRMLSGLFNRLENREHADGIANHSIPSP